MVGLFHANISLMPCQIGNQIFWMKWRFQPVNLGKSRRERVREIRKGIRKAKNPEVPGKMRKHGPTRLHYGHIFFIFTSHYNLSTKWLLHWIWIHVNFWHRLCVTSSRTYKFEFYFFFPNTCISLPHQKICFPTPCGSLCIFLSD